MACTVDFRFSVGDKVRTTAADQNSVERVGVIRCCRFVGAKVGGKMVAVGLDYLVAYADGDQYVPENMLNLIAEGT